MELYFKDKPMLGDTRLVTDVDGISFKNIQGDSTISEEFAKNVGLQGDESRELQDILEPIIATTKWQTNPNLLDNWYFVGGEQFPINRRGKTEYTNNESAIDRWIFGKRAGSESIFTLDSSKNGITLTSMEPSQYADMMQKIPFISDRDLIVTLSVLFKGTISLVYYGKDILTASTSSSEDWDIASFTYTIPSGTNLLTRYFPIFGAANSASCSIKAAKLELGPVQTLAHKEGDEWVLNEIPNYAEQYAICEQYSPLTGEFVGSQHSNPNLLTNWYFIGGGSQQGGGQFPINQRGEIEYRPSANSTYTFDRWLCGAGISLTFGTEGLKITSNGATEGYTFIYQRLEQDVLRFLYGNIVTLSILVKGTAEPVIGNVNLVNYFEPSKNEFKLYQYTYKWPNSGTPTTWNCCPEIGLAGDGDLTIKAAKLELGPVQTLAHKEGDEWVLNDPPPDFQQELAKCQRYYMFFKGQTTVPISQTFNPVPTSNNYANGLVFLPVPLRAVPTLRIHDLYYQVVGVADIIDIPDNVTYGVTLVQNFLQLNFNLSGISAGNKNVLRILTYKSADSYLELDANL